MLANDLLKIVDAKYNKEDIDLIDALLYCQWDVVRNLALKKEADESYAAFQKRQSSAESPNHFYHIISSITNQVLAKGVKIIGIDTDNLIDDLPSLLYQFVIDGLAHGMSGMAAGLKHLPRRTLQVVKKTEMLVHEQVYASESALDTRIKNSWSKYAQNGDYIIYTTNPRGLNEDFSASQELFTQEGKEPFPQIWRCPISLGPLLLPTFKAIFRKNSLLDVAEAQNLLPLVVLNLGPEINHKSKMISNSQMDENRGNKAINTYKDKGFMVLGSDDRVSTLQWSSSFYDIALRRTEDFVTDLYTVTNTTALSTSSVKNSKNISGLAKTLDRYAMQLMAKRIGESLKAFLINYFYTIYGLSVQIEGLPIEVLDDGQ